MTVTERTFDVPAVHVFATLLDPETYPRWLVGAKGIREVADDWPAVGSAFKHVVGFGPLVIPDRTTVREIAAPGTFELFVRARPLLEAVVRFEVTDLGARCLLRMTETPAGTYRFLAPLAGPLIRARNERSLRRLQEVVSAPVTAPIAAPVFGEPST